MNHQQALHQLINDYCKWISGECCFSSTDKVNKMKKTIVLYYSKTGNNQFVAKKLAKEIQADLEQIETKTKSFFSLILLTWFKKGAKIIPLDIDLTTYDRVILLGPIWMGNLISPLRGFVKRYGKDIQDFVFITVCGGGDEDKDSKYGFENVFNEMRKLYPSPAITCYEISTKGVGGESTGTSCTTSVGSPTDLPLLTEELFHDDIKDRFDEVVEALKK